MLNAMLDCRGISVGTIHDIVREAVAAAWAMNDTQELSGIRVVAHREIFLAQGCSGGRRRGVPMVLTPH